MGFGRSVIGWILILYGISSIFNAIMFLLTERTLFNVLIQAPSFEEVVVFSLLPPEFTIGIAIFGFLWGTLWIWIGNKVRTGGQQRVRIG